MNFQTLAIHTRHTLANQASPTSPPIDRSTS